MAYYRQIWRVCTVVRASVGSGREKKRGIVQKTMVPEKQIKQNNVLNDTAHSVKKYGIKIS